MTKISKLGWVLVREGIISQQQLNEAVEAKKVEPHKSIGGLISEKFNVPERTIETVFIEEVLLTLADKWLYNDLAKKMKMDQEELRTIVPEIVIELSEFKRNLLTTKTFRRNKGGDFHETDAHNYISTVHCVLEKVIFKTKFGTDVQLSDVAMDYEVQSQRITMDNPGALLEAKVRISQLIKSAA